MDPGRGFSCGESANGNTGGCECAAGKYLTGANVCATCTNGQCVLGAETPNTCHTYCEDSSQGFSCSTTGGCTCEDAGGSGSSGDDALTTAAKKRFVRSAAVMKEGVLDDKCVSCGGVN